MVHIALYQPEIPPNTGNIIRLCANSGAELHLIHPLGFSPTESRVKRAGLDYHEWTRVHHHQDYPAFLSSMEGRRILACSTHATKFYTEPAYSSDDVLLFGPETRGLPSFILEQFKEECKIRIPMLPTSRSLNLSNAVAIILYEALRQGSFQGLG